MRLAHAILAEINRLCARFWHALAALNLAIARWHDARASRR